MSGFEEAYNVEDSLLSLHKRNIFISEHYCVHDTVETFAHHFETSEDTDQKCLADVLGTVNENQKIYNIHIK